MSQRVSPQMTTIIHVESHHDNNSISNQTKECRICLQQSYPLIIPCKCTGTVRYVHQQCITHWARELVSKRLIQQSEEEDFQPLTSIDCQLCKEQIQLRIQWTDVRLTLSQARQRNAECFWPGLIINIVIGLICLGCIGFAFAILGLVLTSNAVVDYQRFRNDPFVTWTTLAGTLIIGFIFLIRSITQIYSIFIRKEFKIDGVMYKQIINSDEKQIDSDKVDNNSPIKLINDFQKSIRSQLKSINQNHPQHTNLPPQGINFQQQQSNNNLVIGEIIKEKLKRKSISVFQSNRPALIN